MTNIELNDSIDFFSSNFDDSVDCYNTTTKNSLKNSSKKSQKNKSTGIHKANYVPSLQSLASIICLIIGALN